MSDESSDESKNEKRPAALELDASAAATGSTSGRKKKARRRQPEESKHNSVSASSIASSANPATQSGVGSSVGAVPDTMLPLFQQLHAPHPPASQAPALTQQQLLLDQLVLRRLQEGFQQSHLQGLSMSGPSASLQQPQQQQQHWQNGISSQELQQIAQSLQQHRQPQVLNPAIAAPHSYPTPPPSRDTDTRTSLNRNAILEHLLRQSNIGVAALPSTGMSNPSPLLRQQHQQQLNELAAAQQLLLNNPALLHSSGPLGGSSLRLELESLLFQQQQPRQEQAQQQQSLSDHRNAVALQSLLDPRLPPELLAAQQQLQQSRHPQPHEQSTAASLRASTGIPLALPNDAEHLSSYQVLLRKQLEFFVSEQADCETSVQGRKKGVQLGQVGLRCRHCAHINPVRLRGRGSIYYPQKLGGVYQAVSRKSVVVYVT